jgi:hypothetical protein
MANAGVFRKAFEKISQDIKYLLPEFASGKHPAGGITVLEKCLKNKDRNQQAIRKMTMGIKKQDYWYWHYRHGTFGQERDTAIG